MWYVNVAIKWCKEWKATAYSIISSALFHDNINSFYNFVYVLLLECDFSNSKWDIFFYISNTKLWDEDESFLLLQTLTYLTADCWDSRKDYENHCLNAVLSETTWSNTFQEKICNLMLVKLLMSEHHLVWNHWIITFMIVGICKFSLFTVWSNIYLTEWILHLVTLENIWFL